ncbi:type VI secretion system baseplate subunit TssK [Chromobacterium haemolyticum]|nr:type VI secretion system baseplate subunit TssK [Chromobacterium haemolyticum]
MSALPVGPVAWSDGMLIETQHFQQQERYLAHQFGLRLRQTSNHGWGFSLLDVDSDGLGLGRLGLRAAEGILPDGTPFALPAHDPLPAPLDTSDAQAGDIACLALPAAGCGGPEMAFGDASAAARYRAAATDRGARSQRGPGRAGLAAPPDAGNRPHDDAAVLAIAIARRGNRLALRPGGGAQQRADAVAGPAFHPAAAGQPRPPDAASADRGVAKHAASAAGRQRAGLRVLSAGGGLADLVELMLRQGIAEYRMRLAHLDAFNPLPPALLFQELIGLLGRLSVLPGVDEALAERQFAYRHDELQASFEPLAATLRYALARVIETPVLPLKFEDRGDQVHVCVVDRQWKLQKMVFAFSAAMPADKLRQLLPQQAKLGAVEQIQKLVDLQLPGARLIPTPNPPRQVPYYAQSVYFEVESSDPFWAQAFAGSALALRIVGDFQDMRFEAWGLREGKVA